MFGIEQLVHKAFGGGKLVDVFLLRNKKISTGKLGRPMVTSLLFELLAYRFYWSWEVVGVC